MATTGGSSRKERRDGRAGARGAWWPGTPILLPILLQVLGGLLALAVAGDVLDGERLPAETVTGATADATGRQPLPDHDSRDRKSDRGSEKTDEFPPAGSSAAGTVPAGVKLSQEPSFASSRVAAGSRAALCRLDLPLPGATPPRGRIASLPALASGTPPLGGSLSPLSPRGPPRPRGRLQS